MANTLRFKRGLVSGIPTAALGEPLFTTDTFDLYIGNGTTNTRFQKYIASGTTSQLLRGDGSLLTMPIVLTSPSNGQVLKFNGTNWVNDSDAGITGSGTTNYLPKFTGGSTLGNSLLQESTNGIGLGISPSAWAVLRGFQVGLTAGVSGYISSTEGAFFSSNMFYDGGAFIYQVNGFATNYLQISGTHRWNTAASGSAAGAITFTERMRLHNNGNLVLGGTVSTDNGLRFQVTGDGFFSGRLGLGSTSLTNTILRVGNNITGAASHFSVFASQSVQSDVSNASIFTTEISTQATAFTLNTLRHYRATQGTFGASSIVTNQYGFFAESTLTGATNNYGFYGDIASGTGRWNLYMNGTANNYMAGSVGIGTTTLTGYTLAVGKNITGSTNAQAIRSVGIIQSDVTSKAYYYTAQSFTANVNFALPDLYLYAAFGGTLSNITAGGSITSQYGYFVDSSLTGATNNFGFYGNIASGTGRWNLYMNGTAANYLAGNLGIGTTTINVSLLGRAITISSANSGLELTSATNVVQGTVQSNTNGLTLEGIGAAGMRFFTSASGATTERMRLDASGNLGLGVTPSAWTSGTYGTNTRVIEISQLGSTIGAGAGALVLSNNVYGDNTNYYFARTGFRATQYAMNTSLGSHIWYNSASGTAGGIISFIQAMTLHSTGNLAIGTGGGADAGFRLDVNGTMRVSGASTITNGTLPSLKINHTAAGHASAWFDTNEFGLLISSASTSASHYLVNMTSNSVSRFRVGCDGAATFSSSVTASSILLSSGGNGVNINQGALGFNRNVGSGAIINSGGFAYQWNKTNSTTNTSDFLDLQVYNTSGTFVNNAVRFDGTGAATFATTATATGLFSTGASNFATSSGNVGIGTAIPGYKLHVQTSGASGTSLGLRVQAGTNSSDAAMQILSQAGSTYLFLRGDNNLGFGTSLVGATGTNTMSVFSGTAPTTNVTDSFQMYSNDIVAGNAAPHFRTENGAVIKLYQQDNSIAAANFVAGIGTSVTTLDAFDGYTIGQVVKALRNAGILL